MNEIGDWLSKYLKRYLLKDIKRPKCLYNFGVTLCHLSHCVNFFDKFCNNGFIAGRSKANNVWHYNSGFKLPVLPKNSQT